MGLLTGSKTPTIFDAMNPQQPSALSRISGMLGGSQGYGAAPVAPQVAAPDQPPPGMVRSPGGGYIPMGGVSPAPGGSAQQPQPTQPDFNQVLEMLAGMFGAQQQQTPPNWLQQQRNPNGVPFQSQAGRPETLADFYGPHGISPTATFATAASQSTIWGCSVPAIHTGVPMPCLAGSQQRSRQ